MMNIIRSDLYRLSKQKSTYLIPVGTFVVFFLLSCVNGFLMGNAGWLKEIHEIIGSGLSSIESQTGLSGIGSISYVLGSNPNSICEYVALTFQRDSMLCVVLFIAMYIVSTRKSGYVKNIPMIYGTLKYSVAQSVILFAYTLMITLVNVVATTLSAGIFFAGTKLGNPLSLLLYAFIVSVAHWVAGLLIVGGVCEGMKNPTGGIVIGCLYTGGVSGLLTTALNALFQSFLGPKFMINYLFPFEYSMVIEYESPKSYLIALGISAAYLVLLLIPKLLKHFRQSKALKNESCGTK